MASSRTWTWVRARVRDRVRGLELGLYLTGNLDLTSNLDVVVIVVGVRSDPEATFLQSCGKINPFMRNLLKHNGDYDDSNGDSLPRADH